MGRGISEVLTFAIGVAVSPVPIIAVILMLFSRRARVNGPVFLAGWVLALAVVSAAVYLLAEAGEAASNSTAVESISWGKIALGVLLLISAERNWRQRPAAGVEPELPKWMASVDTLRPAAAFGLGLLLAGINPKNLILTIGGAAGVAQLGLSGGEVIVSLIVFVLVASLTIAGPVVYYLLGGERAEARLEEIKDWLRVHNAAVIAVLLLVFGVDLIAKGIPSLTG